MDGAPKASGAVVPFGAVQLARRVRAGESLLLIDIINAHGLIVLQTIWARARGPRRTDSETIKDEAQLMRRLGELVPVLLRG